AELTFTDPECGTKMFVDDHHLPEYPMHFNAYNNNTLGDMRHEGMVSTILYPPRKFQYIEGSRWFLVRDRADGYLVAAYNVETIREFRQRHPELWESNGIDANLKVDRWRGAQQRSDKFWILYLPFLREPDYTHRCITNGNYVTYELREDDDVLFECDACEVRDMWGNVRTDQWSARAQRQVAQFLYCLQHGWDYQPPPPYQPRTRSPTPDTMDEYIDYTGGQGESRQPRMDRDGLQRDIPADERPGHDNMDGRQYEFVYEDPNDAASEYSSSSNFSDDISDIEDDLGEWNIAAPGMGTSGERVEFRGGVDAREEGEEDLWWDGTPMRDDAHREWDDRSSHHSHPDDSGDDSRANQSRPGTPDDVKPYQIDGSACAYGDMEFIVREVQYEGQTIQYALEDGKPWFFGCNQEDADWYNYLWRWERLVIPGSIRPREDDYDSDVPNDVPYDYSDYES